ncbi:MAG TPA: hypothetical protein VN018_09905 [Brevundimonas sp.]|nr:hypothetical protein [Brevundimonas sp.]
MGVFSIWHWIVVAVVLAVLGYPAARILRRLGFSPWWVLLAFVPYVNLIGLWALAFVKWPIERR